MAEIEDNNVSFEEDDHRVIFISAFYLTAFVYHDKILTHSNRRPSSSMQPQETTAVVAIVNKLLVLSRGARLLKRMLPI
jgi:hypothetical protein